MKHIQSWYLTIFNWSIRLGTVLVLVSLAYIIYSNLVEAIVGARYLYRFFAFLALWLFTAYFTLPRIHRRLSKFYLPNYFIGRVQTGDGLLGDAVNLAVNGNKRQLIEAMEKAGWTKAEDLNTKSWFKIIDASIRGKSYPNAPVSSLYLFGRVQDLAFEREVNGNPRKRHHVRFWKTPRYWWLPGGYKADWIGAAVYDSNIGFSLFTGQITHRIDADIDKERDYVIRTLEKADALDNFKVIKNYMSGFYGRNGGGFAFETDGAMPFVNLK